MKIVLSAAALFVLASAQAQTGGEARAPPGLYQGPDATTFHPKSTMQAGDSWIAEALRDQTFVIRHHIPYSRVSMPKTSGLNQIGVGVELTGAERFVNFGELNWRRHPSGHYAAVIVYTVERAAALRIALNLTDFPEKLTVKFVSADKTRPYPEASLDHAGASGYLNRDVSVHWSPIHSGNTVYVELNYPDITEAGFAAGRVELPAISYIFAGGPWDVKTQPKPAPSADGGFVIAKARANSACAMDVSCEIAGIPDAAKENFSRATGYLVITSGGGIAFTCTGHLIADTDAATDLPYMLTANHCVSTPEIAANVVAVWDYRSASCGGDVEQESSPRTRGSELLVTSSVQDWSFLILGSDSNPAVLPGKRYFLGWDSASPVRGEILHHIGHAHRNPQSYARGRVNLLNRSVGRLTGLLQLRWLAGHHSGSGASGSVLVRNDNGSLYARTGGLSLGQTGGINECITLTPNTFQLYHAVQHLSPFSAVYQNQRVRDRLGSGQQRAEGTSADGDVVVTLASDASVIEGDSGDTHGLVFNLMRSGTTTQALPFMWETLDLRGNNGPGFLEVLSFIGLATSELDFNQVLPTRGIFPAGERTAALIVTVRGDTIEERDEIVGIRVSHIDSGLPSLAESLRGYIRDDDDDHGNNRESATPLVGSGVITLNARIDYGDDRDYFLVTVPQNSEDFSLAVSAVVTAASDDFDIVGAIEEGDGIELINSVVLSLTGTFNPGRSISLRLDRVSPGSYYIRVRRYGFGFGQQAPFREYTLTVTGGQFVDPGSTFVPPSVTILEDGSISVNEDEELASTAVATANPAEDAQVITSVSIVESRVTMVNTDGSSIDDLLLSASFSLAGDGETVLFAATPVADRFGTAVFMVAVTDSRGGSSTFEFTLTVLPVNDAPVITVDDSMTLTPVGGGAPVGVTVSLSDVDVNAAVGNEALFAQSGDTLVMSVDTDAVTLTLQGLAGMEGDAMLNGAVVATVTGSGLSRMTLTFTREVTAAQVKALVEMVEVRADADAVTAMHELTIALTTGVNEAGRGGQNRLTGIRTVPVQVFAAGEPPALQNVETGVLAESTLAAGVILQLSRQLEAGESVTVTYVLDFSGSASEADIDDPNAGVVRLDEDGRNTVSIELEAVADDNVEGGETFEVRFAADFRAGDGTVENLAEMATRVVSISDATPPLRVSFDQAAYSFAENVSSPAAVLSVRSGAVGEVRLVSTVVVSVATEDGTAEAPGDYTAQTGDSEMVEIPAGVYSTATATAIPVSLAIVDDSGVERDEAFTLTLSVSDERVAAVAPYRATVTIENDDVSDETVAFIPQAVTVARGDNADVEVSLGAVLIPGQSATLRLTAVQGLALNSSVTHDVALDDVTTSRFVTVAAAVDAPLGDHQVAVTVLDPVGVRVTTVPLTVTVIPAVLAVTQSDGTDVARDVMESVLQTGIAIDGGIEVEFVRGSAGISTIRATLAGDSEGNLEGAEFMATVTAGFTGSDGEYTSAAGATAVQARNLLRSLALRLGTENPPGRATVTVVVEPTGGSNDVTVEYPLDITDENELPEVLVLSTGLAVVEDSGRMEVGIVTVDPVEPDQRILDAVIVVASTVTVSSGGTGIGDLLQEESSAEVFSVDSGESGPATVTFTGTPASDAHGTAGFALRAMDSGDGGNLSSTFLFTLTVAPVNDTPVITVVDDPARLILIGGGGPRRVTVSLSDVDVSAEVGNEALFVQSGDTLVMSVSTDTVTLTLRRLEGPAGDAMLNGAAVATVTGNASPRIQLAFTSGLSAVQVKALVEMVEVRADVDAEIDAHELTIELTTGVNETDRRGRDRLTGIRTVPVLVVAAGELLVLESAEPEILVEGTIAAGVILQLSRRLRADESVTVTYALDFSGSASEADVDDPNAGVVTLVEDDQSTISIELEAVADDNVEDEEIFEVRFRAAFRAGDGTVENLAEMTTRVISISDATPPLRVSFDQAAYSFAENVSSPAVVLNVRSGAVGEVRLVSTVVVSVATEDGTAEAPGDYMARTGDNVMVEIPAGVYSTAPAPPFAIPVPLVIVDNSDVERNETFTLNLTASDKRVAAVAPYRATVTIENDDVSDATVVFIPGHIVVVRGGDTNVGVGLEPALIGNQSATLRLVSVFPGITLNGSMTHDVALDAVTTSRVVTIAATVDAFLLIDNPVTVTVLDSTGVRVRTFNTSVQVNLPVLEVRQSTGTDVARDVTASSLRRAGIAIDSGIEVEFVLGRGSISTIRATLAGVSDDDLERAEFIATVTEGFTGSDGEYTSATGATTDQAQALLRSLVLRLGIQNPPGLAMVTVLVQPSDGFSDVAVEYLLNITNENEPPAVVTVLSTRLTILEDSEAAEADIVVVDPVEPGQRILDAVIVAASTVTVSSGGTSIGDLLQEDLADVFSADNGESGTATVTFTGTPVPDANGTAEFELRVSDSEDLSSTFLFTLTVAPVNDAPVITVDDSMTLTPVGGGAPVGVTVSLSDVDVNAAAGNEALFAQSGDTLVMSVDTDTVILTLQGLAGMEGDAMLNGTVVATVTGSGLSRMTLMFTREVTAAQVKALVEMVEVRADADAVTAMHELTIELTTGVNEAGRRREQNRLTGIRTVPVQVFAAGEPPALQNVETGVLAESTPAAGVILQLSRQLEAGESVTVTYVLDFSGGSASEADINDPNAGVVRLDEDGRNTVSIELEAVADDNVEGGETFEVRFAVDFRAGDGTVENLAEMATRVISISDATPPLRVSFDQAAYSFAENVSSPAAVLSVRSGADGEVRLVSTVVVSVATEDGTAEAPGDYTTQTGDSEMVEIPAGVYSTATATAIPVLLAIVGDSDVERDEAFTLTLSVSDERVAAVAPYRATVTIENDDASDETVAFIPQAVTVARGDNADVEVSLGAVLIPGQSATLRLTAVQGLTLNNSVTHDVALDDVTTSRFVTVAAAVDAPLGDHQVAVTVLDPVGVRVTTAPLTVTVIPAVLAVTQSDGTDVARDVMESVLQTGIAIDGGIEVEFVRGSAGIGAIRATLAGDSEGNLEGTEFMATVTAGFTGSDGEYTSAAGATAVQARDLLRSLALRLGTENPPGRATVTVVVEPTGGSNDVTVEYPLDIIDENESPEVLVLSTGLAVVEDNGQVEVGIVTVDPVEPDQRILDAVIVVSSTVTVSSGGTGIGDLLQEESSAEMFSVDNDESGPATVTFTGTPAPDAHGTAGFELRVSDGEDLSSTFLFTLTVLSVNDTPVITVAESSSPLTLVGGERRGVVAGLSDVDVGAAGGNLNRFAQAGDTLALRLPEGAADVTLRLRNGLADEGGRVFLDGSAVAAVQGDGGTQVTLTFTAGLTAVQVEELVEAVEVSTPETATAGHYELTIVLTTDFNDGVVRREEDRRPLAGVAVVPVEVDERTMLTVSFDRAGIEVSAGRGSTVGLSVSPVLSNSEEITVMLDVESGSGSVAVTVLPSEVVFDMSRSATEVTVRVADGIEHGTTARVTIDATATGGNVLASAGNSLLVEVVSGILLRIRVFLEGALQ